MRIFFGIVKLDMSGFLYGMSWSDIRTWASEASSLHESEVMQLCSRAPLGVRHHKRSLIRLIDLFVPCQFICKANIYVVNPHACQR